jgi:hypothetical protein
MCSGLSDARDSLTAIQLELRELARDAAAHSGTRPSMPIFGCRLLHWNPELENFRAEPTGCIVYQPLDVRVDGKTHVFFLRVYKTKYAKSGQKRNEPGLPERQYGITYRQFDPKSEVIRIHDAFKRCATQAGALVGSVQERLASVLPSETLATKNDLHRWIFTVYDVAWHAPADSPRSATRYIPMTGFDPSMNTDESVIYDLDHIRSTPWRKVERRLDRNRWGSFSHFKQAYASWSEKLLEYYASRIDDIIQASRWSIDWLINQVSDST